MAEEKDMNQGEERVTDSSEPVLNESTEAQMPDSKTGDEPSEQTDEVTVDALQYEGYAEKYKKMVLEAIEKERHSHE